MQGKTGADDGMETDDADGGGGKGNGGGENAVALELLPLPQINIVDFGSIHINERAARKVEHSTVVAGVISVVKHFGPRGLDFETFGRILGSTSVCAKCERRRGHAALYQSI